MLNKFGSTYLHTNHINSQYCHILSLWFHSNFSAFYIVPHAYPGLSSHRISCHKNHIDGCVSWDERPRCACEYFEFSSIGDGKWCTRKCLVPFEKCTVLCCRDANSLAASSLKTYQAKDRFCSYTFKVYWSVHNQTFNLYLNIWNIAIDLQRWTFHECFFISKMFQHHFHAFFIEHKFKIYFRMSNAFIYFK